MRVAKRLGPGSKMADFVDTSPNPNVGTPANEWNEWNRALGHWL